MKPDTQKALTSALFEAGFVVLGVVLALAANEWRQHRADSRRADEALASLIEELRTNREDVRAARDYHHEIVGMLHRTGDETPSPREFHRGFISPAQVSQTVWDVAGQTGTLSDMRYATVIRLSEIYSQQARYEDQGRIASELIYGQLFRGGSQAVVANHRNLGSILRTFLYRENQLLEQYDAALAALGVDDSASATP